MFHFFPLLLLNGKCVAGMSHSVDPKGGTQGRWRHCRRSSVLLLYPIDLFLYCLPPSLHCSLSYPQRHAMPISSLERKWNPGKEVKKSVFWTKTRPQLQLGVLSEFLCQIFNIWAFWNFFAVFVSSWSVSWSNMKPTEPLVQCVLAIFLPLAELWPRLQNNFRLGEKVVQLKPRKSFYASWE